MREKTERASESAASRRIKESVSSVSQKKSVENRMAHHLLHLCLKVLLQQTDGQRAVPTRLVRWSFSSSIASILSKERDESLAREKKTSTEQQTQQTCGFFFFPLLFRLQCRSCCSSNGFTERQFLSS